MRPWMSKILLCATLVVGLSSFGVTVRADTLSFGFGWTLAPLLPGTPTLNVSSPFISSVDLTAGTPFSLDLGGVGLAPGAPFAPGTYSYSLTANFTFLDPVTGLPNGTFYSDTGMGSFTVQSGLGVIASSIIWGPFQNITLSDGSILNVNMSSIFPMFGSFPSLERVTFTLQSSPSAVPLPAALPLFASGLGGLAWLARRRKRGQASTA